MTCLTTTAVCLAYGIDVRSGPPFPPWPFEPWQTEQFAAKIWAPAAAFGAAAPPGLAGLLLFGASPACSTAVPAPPAATGPIVPSSPKSQRLSPCEVPASE